MWASPEVSANMPSQSAISRCDVLFSIGTRFNDRITGKVEQFAPHAVIIHVDIDSASISRNIAVDIPIVADAKKAVCALFDKAESLDVMEWVDEINGWKTQHPITMTPGGLTPEKIIRSVNEIFDHAIIATDVGQNQLWATPFLELGEHRQMLTSGGLGTMGYGFPAAIGAKIGSPETDVILITRDGGMQMNIQEMATAIAYELPITICILNNGYLGNVRQWQEMFFDRRYSSTCMRYRKSCDTACSRPTGSCPPYTPDFIKLAESYGAKGIRVTEEKDISTALLAAKSTKKVPTVIEFIIDREENVLPIVPPGNALNCMILESEVGTLARISGLFSGKSYNLNSLTVGTTEDSTISRMTISLTSDDKTFEQVKKQLNRSVEVIKVVDYTDTAIHMKELMFIKINCCSDQDITEAFRIARIFGGTVIDYNCTSLLLESVQTELQNNELIALLEKCFVKRIEIVRGGSVAVEALAK